MFMGFFTAVCGVLIGCFPARWLGGCFIVAGMSACGWPCVLRVSACWCGVECSGWVLVVACSVSAVRLASTNPPAGTPNCLCGALAGWLIYTHAWWCPVNFSETWAVHWLDNFLCVSTDSCGFVCLTYVPVVLGVNQTLPLR